LALPVHETTFDPSVDGVDLHPLGRTEPTDSFQLIYWLHSKASKKGHLKELRWCLSKGRWASIPSHSSPAECYSICSQNCRSHRHLLPELTMLTKLLWVWWEVFRRSQRICRHTIFFSRAVKLEKTSLSLRQMSKWRGGLDLFPTLRWQYPSRLKALKLSANICSNPFTLGYFPPELGWHLLYVHTTASSSRDGSSSGGRKLYGWAPTSMLTGDMVAGAQHYRWRWDEAASR